MVYKISVISLLAGIGTLGQAQAQVFAPPPNAPVLPTQTTTVVPSDPNPVYTTNAQQPPPSFFDAFGPDAPPTPGAGNTPSPSAVGDVPIDYTLQSDSLSPATAPLLVDTASPGALDDAPVDFTSQTETLSPETAPLITGSASPGALQDAPSSYNFPTDTTSAAAQVLTDISDPASSGSPPGTAPVTYPDPTIEIPAATVDPLSGPPMGSTPNWYDPFADNISTINLPEDTPPGELNTPIIDPTDTTGDNNTTQNIGNDDTTDEFDQEFEFLFH